MAKQPLTREPVTFRLASDTIREVERTAKREGLTRAEWIERLVTRAVSKVAA